MTDALGIYLFYGENKHNSKLRRRAYYGRFNYFSLIAMRLKVRNAYTSVSEARFLNKTKVSRDNFRNSLETAKNYAEVWQIVKDTVEFSLNMRRGSMMLFLEDLPLQLGAYHPLGTNNIVLNRALIEIIETSINSKQILNALVYNLLLHEYLHALGELSETKVRRNVVRIARKSFGEDYITTVIAKKTPWILLQNIPIQTTNTPKRIMQIVKDFEKTEKYIV
jgi:hypothetical protein